jgi:hypothetical protein
MWNCEKCKASSPDECTCEKARPSSDGVALADLLGCCRWHADCPVGKCRFVMTNEADFLRNARQCQFAHDAAPLAVALSSARDEIARAGFERDSDLNAFMRFIIDDLKLTGDDESFDWRKGFDLIRAHILTEERAKTVKRIADVEGAMRRIDSIRVGTPPALPTGWSRAFAECQQIARDALAATVARGKVWTGDPRWFEELQKLKPREHDAMCVSDSYALLIDLFRDAQEAHMIISNGAGYRSRAKRLHDSTRLPARVMKLVERVADLEFKARAAAEVYQSSVTAREQIEKKLRHLQGKFGLWDEQAVANHMEFVIRSPQINGELRNRIAELERQRTELQAACTREVLARREAESANLIHLCGIDDILKSWTCLRNADAVECGHVICRERHFVKRFDALSRQIATSQAREHEWALALQSLTPGGSEYVDDPERCVAFVRETRDVQHGRIIDLVRKNRVAQSAMETARSFIQRWADDKHNAGACRKCDAVEALAAINATAPTTPTDQRPIDDQIIAAAQLATDAGLHDAAAWIKKMATETVDRKLREFDEPEMSVAVALAHLCLTDWIDTIRAGVIAAKESGPTKDPYRDALARGVAAKDAFDGAMIAVRDEAVAERDASSATPQPTNEPDTLCHWCDRKQAAGSYFCCDICPMSDGDTHAEKCSPELAPAVIAERFGSEDDPTGSVAMLYGSTLESRVERLLAMLAEETCHHDGEPIEHSAGVHGAIDKVRELLVTDVVAQEPDDATAARSSDACPYENCGHAFERHIKGMACSDCPCPEWIGWAWCYENASVPHCINFGSLEQCAYADEINGVKSVHRHHDPHSVAEKGDR